MRNERSKGARIEKRTMVFAVRVGKAIDAAPDRQFGRYIAGQLVRAETSTAPYHAMSSQSRSNKN